jgi:iron-sulfur cluster assembly accessory protein
MKIDVNFKISENALKEIKKVKNENEDLKNQYLRISIKGGGCSGFMYGLGFEEDIDENSDFIENYDGIDVVIDKKSALFLNDVTLDWIEDINQRGFKFNNPNATKTCGCGQSFQ